MSTALLMIDVQNAFFDGIHTPPIAEAEATLARQAALVARARAAGVPVVFVRHNEPGSEFDPGSPSWNLHPALGAAPGDPVVDKTKLDSFAGTDLAARLAALGARHLIVAGNQTEMCVNATARRAAALGYEVTVVSDGHGTFDGDTPAAEVIAVHNAAFAREVGEIRSSAELDF